MKSLLRWSARILALILVLFAAALAAVFAVLWRSLPETDGTVRVTGLGANVSIARDAIGVPTIDATNRVDAARALGFLHGQERFFQMDLLRRAAAGELSELFGPIALRADKSVRIHRFRSAARAVVSSMNPGERAQLQAYAEGVATGLSKLGSRPFEYWILRASPEPWRAEDSILVQYAMWLDLQESDGEPDRSRAVVRDLFPPEVAEFLLSAADPFQAAIDGSVIEAPPLPPSPGLVPTQATQTGLRPGNPPQPAFLTTVEGSSARPLPASNFTLRNASTPQPPRTPTAPAPRSVSQPLLDLLPWGVASKNRGYTRSEEAGSEEAGSEEARETGSLSSAESRMFAALFPARDPDYAIGSNNWAVAGSRTATGGALVANDMHLGLRMPHIWYRADIRIRSGGNNESRVTGLTLPGTPVLISGSNGHIAWGFTNAEIDTSDVVLVEPDPTDSSRYLTPDGPRAFENFEESIRVNGGEPQTLTVRWTQWGPVLGEDHRSAGQQNTIALSWTANKPAPPT